MKRDSEKFRICLGPQYTMVYLRLRTTLGGGKGKSPILYIRSLSQLRANYRGILADACREFGRNTLVSVMSVVAIIPIRWPFLTHQARNGERPCTSAALL